MLFRYALAILVFSLFGCEDLFGNGIDNFSVSAGGFCTEDLDCEGSLLCMEYQCDNAGGGGYECIPSGSSSYCDSNEACCSGICLVETDSCHDSCSSDSDCYSGCCVALSGGGGACADSGFCY